jgi:hypothetical protein
MHVSLQPTAARRLLVFADHPRSPGTAAENSNEFDISPVYRRLRDSMRRESRAGTPRAVEITERNNMLKHFSTDLLLEN